MGSRVNHAQQLRISLGIHRTIAPLEAKVRLIPNNDMLHRSLVSGDEGRHELGEVRVMFCVEVSEGGLLLIRIGARPCRNHSQASDHGQSLVLGMSNKHIAMLPIVTALFRFKVSPGEIFHHPRSAHFTHQG